jgi:hypothetical protein
MSRTVPEKRVDKNGRVVTRHVLADPSTGRQVSAVPPPAPASVPAATSVDYYAGEIANYLLEAAGETDIEFARSLYAGALDSGTLRLIHERMHDWNERDGDLFVETLQLAITKTVARGDTEENRNRLAVILAETLPVISAFSRHPVNAHYAMDVVYGANYAATHFAGGSDGSDIVSDMTQTDREMLHWMTFEFIVMNVSTSRPRAWLQDESRWFADNMDRLALQADTIRKRGTTDREFLSELVAADKSVALAEGTL